jgi:hypothetical protein
MTSETEREFKIGDVIAKVGYPNPATVLGQGSGHYFVRWRGSGDSMLWTDEVERDYVLVERGIDDD